MTRSAFIAALPNDFGGLLLLPVILLYVGFWLWMLVDCANREKEVGTKIAWLLIILFVGLLGAPLYFFLRKAPRRTQVPYQPPSHLQQPWRKR